ncbi:VanZ family protein [Tannockella kyphosi]|uniref:VanZ family protein n=1 Tax=Tannockella kyphosi TaxID=2899121 RepID=UPI0020112144|nr:VanZ family protein [Tannockella kyphosi]
MEKMKKACFFIPAISWMGLIFWFSNQDGTISGNSSGEVLEKVIYYMETYLSKIFYYLKDHLYLLKYSVLLVIIFLSILCFYAIYRSKSKTLKITTIVILLALLYFIWGYRNDYTQLFILPNSVVSFGYKVIDYGIAYIRSATLQTLELLIRKAAHISLYFGLYLLLFFGFLQGLKKEDYAMPYTLSFLYAMSDEFHQLFIDGRGASLRDVAIDGLGITAALFLSIFLMFVFKTIKQIYIDIKAKKLSK